MKKYRVFVGDYLPMDILTVAGWAWRNHLPMLIWTDEGYLGNRIVTYKLRNGTMPKNGILIIREVDRPLFRIKFA